MNDDIGTVVSELFREFSADYEIILDSGHRYFPRGGRLLETDATLRFSAPENSSPIPRAGVIVPSNYDHLLVVPFPSLTNPELGSIMDRLKSKTPYDAVYFPNFWP